MSTLPIFVKRFGPTIAAAALAIAMSAPASAQQPQPDARQVLGQAEAQSARRTASDFLSRLLGSSPARAQTSPAEPAAQTPATGTGSPPAVNAPTAAPIRTAQSVPQPLPPANDAPAAGSGTSADPTMIVRIPSTGGTETTAGASSPTSADRPVTLDPIMPAPPTSAGGPAATVTTATPGNAPVVRASAGVASAARPVRVLVASQRRAWCAPAYR